MKIISWNCKMAFRKKCTQILAYKPDVLVIPECENIEKLNANGANISFDDVLWTGENPNKGLGVFTFNGFSIEQAQSHDQRLKYILPAKLSKNGKFITNIIAYWVQKGAKNYTEYTHDSISKYAHLLNKKSILIGDFNSNKIWDKNSSIGNHSKTVELLAAHQIFSVYHHLKNENFGEEQEATFYMYHHQDKPYHIDYCFVSESLLEKVESIETGRFEDWCRLSDHCPVVVKMNI